jgi:hypothetical protein
VSLPLVWLVSAVAVAKPKRGKAERWIEQQRHHHHRHHGSLHR